MGEQGEYWRDVGPGMREDARDKKKSNRENSARILRQAGVVFKTNNDGVHLMIGEGEQRIDFWPSTGKYISRDGKNGRGVFNLLRMLKKRAV